MAGLPTGIDRSGRSGRMVVHRHESSLQARERVMFCRKCGAVNPDDSTFCQSCGTRFSRTGVVPPKSSVYDEEQLLREVLAGQYEVIRRLGAGGMANVYFAREEALDRYVAVKVLPQAYLRNEDFVERFKREAKISAQLEHPNIITIHTIGIQENIVYFVMSYLPGGSLADRIRDSHGLGVLEVIRWGRDIAKALAYAHERGVIHRDLKPENVMLDDKENAVVTDFGIAFAAESTRMTKTGVAVGTAAYMSPEQAAGKTIDGRSDIYSLGVLLYQMATGTLPFQATNPASLMYQHVHEPPEPPDIRNAAVPGWLRETILTCLAKKPGDRFATAAGVLAALTDGYHRFKNDRRPAHAAARPDDDDNLTRELRKLPARPAEDSASVQRSPEDALPQPHELPKTMPPPPLNIVPEISASAEPVMKPDAPEPVNPAPAAMPTMPPPAEPVPSMEDSSRAETAMHVPRGIPSALFLPSIATGTLRKWLRVTGVSVAGLVVVAVLVWLFARPTNLRDWEWIAEPQYEWVQSFDGQGLARIMVDGLYGFMDLSGEVVIIPRYEDVWPFEGDFTAVKENGWWGCINIHGEVLTTTQFDNARNYQDGLVPVQIGISWGYVAASGGLAIKPQFEDVGMFSEGVAPVYRNRGWGVINRSGMLITPTRYEFVETASEGFLAVCMDGRWGYLDTYGDLMIEPRFDSAGPFVDGRGLVSSGGRWGYIDSSGSYAIDPVFEEAMSFNNGYARVYTDDGWAFIDTGGAMLTDERFEDAGSFTEGFALVMLNGLWGYLGDDGSLAIAPAFEDARDFHEGVAPVRSGGRWGYIDTTGGYVVEPQFTNACPFVQGIAAVQTIDGWGYITFTE